MSNLKLLSTSKAELPLVFTKKQQKKHGKALFFQCFLCAVQQQKINVINFINFFKHLQI